MSEQYSLEEEIQHAHAAYKARDFENTVFHIAGALAQDPVNREALSLFDAVIEQVPEHDNLITLSENNFYGEVIACAYLKARKGEYETALNLLIQVFTQFPELPLELWLDKWLSDARFCAVKIDIETVVNFLKGLIQGAQERVRLRPSEIAFFKRFTRLILTLEKYYYDYPELLVLGANILRRAERYEEAQHLAAGRFQKNPEESAAIAQAMAYRAAGQYNRAIQAYDQAWKLSAKPELFIEMAKAKWDAGGQKAAAKFLKKGFKKSETQFDNNQDYHLMQRYLNADAELTRVLGKDVRPDDFIHLVSPLQGYLLPVRDASLTSLASVAQDELKGQTIQIAVNCIEPPSVRLALAMIINGNHNIGTLEYLFDDIPANDPRMHHHNPAIRAWTYEGSVPVQACNPPRHDAVALVLSLAQQDYYLPRWWQQARKLMMGHSMNLADLIGVMTYPPDCPAEMQEKLGTGQWIKHVQIAAALLIAAPENQWKKSGRREILLGLLDGPIDWTTEAALIALTEIGLDFPEAIPEISFAMETLAGRIPETGYWSIAATLPICYQQLPGRPHYILNSMNSMLSRYHDAVAILEPRPEEQRIEDSIDETIEESLKHQTEIEDSDYEDIKIVPEENLADTMADTKTVAAEPEVKNPAMTNPGTNL